MELAEVNVGNVKQNGNPSASSESKAPNAVENNANGAGDNKNVSPKINQPANEAKPDENSKDFAYLERDEFTSEIYKIEVRNLGYFGIGEFKKLIKNKLKLDMTKVKSPLRKDFAYVCFRNCDEQRRAIECLNGYKWKGKVLTASEAKASADPLQKKRRQETESSTQPKKQRTSVEATCPLYHLPYDKQLEQKSNNIADILKGFVNSLKHLNPEFKKFEHEFIYDKQSLVKPSPLVNGYRNKSEFTVGRNKDNEVVVGCRLSSYVDGSVEVAEIQDSPHLTEAAKWAASSFQHFMRNSEARYLPFNPESNSGHVRQVMVRTTQHSEEIMIMPGINTENMKPEEVEQFKKDLKKFYIDNAAADEKFRCTSLYVQDVKRRKPGQMVYPVEHLAGTLHITEKLLDLKFAISPLAFFQVNTPAAEVLYQTAIDLARPRPESFMLDICCGTGTIGLAFAKHCRQVLGVDIVADAIADAKRNAQANGIENCKFFAGNADDMIKSMARDIMYRNSKEKDTLDLIAVVDPPRSGLHNRSIHAIRGTAAIKRLVYISCSPESAKRNWLDLGRPESKQYSGDPFFPKKAIAVDLFPHTMHTELIILFERGDNDKEAIKVVEETEAAPPTVAVANIENETALQAVQLEKPIELETKASNTETAETQA